MIREIDIVNEIDRIKALLEGPLPQSEIDHGWNKEMVNAACKLLDSLRYDINSKIPRRKLKKKPEYFGMVRGFAWSGIGVQSDVLGNLARLEDKISQYINKK